jgi:uncharacterized membrane protein
VLRKRLRAAAGPRLLLGLLVGIATGLSWPAHHSLALRIIAGWDAGALTLLTYIWVVILTVDATKTCVRAAAEDPGRTAVWALVLITCGVSLFAGAVVLRNAAAIDPQRKLLLVAMCLFAVLLAWTLTHTAFSLRYAHLYYRDDAEGEGGLDFPGGAKPADFDFAYFSYTIGMCFQVSDVTVSSPQIRRLVLAHAVLSFAYNTVVLALSLNLLFGVLG